MGKDFYKILRVCRGAAFSTLSHTIFVFHTQQLFLDYRVFHTFISLKTV